MWSSSTSGQQKLPNLRDSFSHARIDVGEAITVQKAPVAPVFQKLALIIAGDFMLNEKQMRRATAIERELELQAINELLRFSGTIKNISPSPDEACDILYRLKQCLDELDIPW